MKDFIGRVSEVAFTLITLSPFYHEMYTSVRDKTDPVTAATTVVKFNEADDLSCEALVRAYACLRIVEAHEAHLDGEVDEVSILEISPGAELIDSSNPMDQEGLEL